MNAPQYDAIVLGTGGIGSAALYEFARRGLRVLGLDRYPPGHDRGSSHGETRMIRLSYFEHPDYVPLLRRAYEKWDELDPELLVRCGVLYAGAAQGETLGGIRRAAAEYGLDVAPGAPAGLRHAPVPPGLDSLFEGVAGYLPVERCVRTHIERALLAGAEHRHGVNVLGWRERDGVVSVSTDAGDFTTARLAIAAGGWSAGLLSQLGLPLQVLRKHLHWFDQGRLELDCAFFFELEHGCWYGFPPLQGAVKIAEHSGGEPVRDPGSASREPDPQERRRLQDFASQYLPGLGPHLRQDVCFYTMTPDGQFIVDRLPGSERVALVAGLSGHGFKFAPVLGEVLADLLLEGDTGFDLEFLSLGRFQAAG